MIPLIYVLNNADLCDAGEMALATLDGLRDEFQPFVFAPEGKVVAEARSMGFFAQNFDGNRNLTFKLWLLLAAYREVAFVATEPAHSLSMNILNTFYRRRMTHLQVVDGTSADIAAHPRKSGFGGDDVIFVTRSESIRDTLIAQGTRQERVRVIEGFLSQNKINQLPRRRPFKKNGVSKVLVFGAGDSDGAALILKALLKSAPLVDLELIVFDVPINSDASEMLSASGFNVTFAAENQSLADYLTSADLLIQLSAPRASGTAVLEAFAAGVPILAGVDENAASFISHNINGFCFRRDDAVDLARQLERLSVVPFDVLNAVAKGGRYLLQIRFSAEKGVERFRRLVSVQASSVVGLTGGKVIL